MIEFKYENGVARTFAHVSNQNVSVDIFDATEKHGEFLCIDVYDPKTKQSVKLFFSDKSLDEIVEKMSVICALRFKKGTSQ